MSNAKLKKFLKDIKCNIESSQCQDDLVGVIEKVKQLDLPLRYDDTVPYCISGFSLVSAVLLFSLKYTLYGDIDTNTVILTAVLVALCVGVIVFILLRKKSIKDLSDSIFEKDCLIDNALKPVLFNPQEKAYQLGKCFHEFNRGNYSREIKTLHSGSFRGNEHVFDYHYYHFHYVDRKVKTEVVSDGKGGTRTETRTRYYRYDRYGICLPFKFASNIAILNYKLSGIIGENFRPASNKFNKLFSVKAKSDMAAAKFLKPMVVTSFEDISQVFSKLNFEFNSDSQLCMSFSDKDLLASKRKRQYGLDDPDNFTNEIKTFQMLPKLEKALEHIHTLMKYSDSNFSETNV